MAWPGRVDSTLAEASGCNVARSTADFLLSGLERRRVAQERIAPSSEGERDTRIVGLSYNRNQCGIADQIR